QEPTRPAVAGAQEARKEEERPVAGVTVSGDVPSSVGGRGYFPRPWSGMASSQCRPCQPRPTQGDVGDRELPHGSTRRPCRALRERELRLYADRLQLLPQPALPEVPGSGGARVACRARERAVAGSVL